MSITSSPTTYTYPNQGSGAHTFTFVIPSGTYSAASWSFAYNFATFTAGGTVQLQISVAGSVYKDLGRMVTASGGYTDTPAAAMDHVGFFNRYAGQTCTITLTPQAISGSVSWTNLAITAFSLTLTAHTTAFGKKWSADALDEHVVLSWIDNDAHCYVSQHRGLAALKGSLSTGWSTKVDLESYSEDVNLGIFTNGRVYLSYTKSDISKLVLSTQYVTNDQFGIGTSSDWTTAVEVAHTLDPTDNHPTGGAFQAWTGHYVVSQSDNTGKNYFLRTADRLAQINDRTYQVLVSGSYVGQIGVYSCTDNQGAEWKWRNNSAVTGGYTGNYNSYDGLINRFDPKIGTALSDAYVGRMYNRMVGAPLACSPIVQDKQGNLCQIVWTNQYNKVAKWLPNVFDMSNNDAALGFKVSTAVDMAIPTDANGLSINSADFCIDWDYQERPYTDCVVPKGDKPASITIPVPAMAGIPDPSVDYGLQMYIDLDFTYTGAKDFKMRFGGDAGVPTSSWGQTYPVSGRGEYKSSTRFYLSNTDQYNIWAARGSNIDLPITYSGTVDTLTFKSVQWEYNYYGSYLFGGAKITLNSVSDVTHTTIERNPSTASTTSSTASNAEFRMSTIAAPLVIADLNAAAGSTWHATLTVDKGSPGSQPSTPYPYIFKVLEGFTVLSYVASGYDFYCVRSRDGGRFWEFANNAQPITALSSLKSLNLLGTGSLSVPVLAAAGDTLYALWVEAGAPKCIMTQSQGDLWEL